MSQIQTHDPMARTGSGNVTAAEPNLFNLPAETKPARLVYNGQVPHARTETSRAAAARMRTRAPSLRMTILAAVRERGDEGMTGEEAGAMYAESKGLPPDTTACRLSAGARMTELRLGGLIADSGRRRKTRAGCSSIVFVATAKEGDGAVCERIAQ